MPDVTGFQGFLITYELICPILEGLDIWGFGREDLLRALRNRYPRKTTLPLFF